MKPSNGILHKMTSPLMDGVEIVFLLTGVSSPGNKGSENRKTGPMQQVSILVDGKLAMDAVKEGLDFAICGPCKHRGKVVDGKIVGRTCYVLIHKSITTITKKMLGMSVRKGCKPNPYGKGEVNPGQSIRLGMYGDPGLIPIELLEKWCETAGSWTGYTHQWSLLDADEHGRFLMASCDSPEDHEMAKSLGWRTFTVAP